MTASAGPANLDATPPAFLKQEMASRITAAMRWALATSEPLDERLLLVQAAGNEAAETPGNGGLGLLFSGIRQATWSRPSRWPHSSRCWTACFLPAPTRPEASGTAPPHPSLLLNDANFQHLQDLLAQWVTRLPNRSNLVLVGSATNPAPPAAVTVSPQRRHCLARGRRERSHTWPGTGRHQLCGAPGRRAGRLPAGRSPIWRTARRVRRSHSSRQQRLPTACSMPTRPLSPSMRCSPLIPGIREALLDVNGDDRFDHQDLLRFKTVYGLDDPNTPTIPTTRDYSRFDLNGDGATGGIITAAFDLDRNAIGPDGAPLINAVDREIEGYPLTFNEAALSDLQILCYYAYSTLYASTDPTDVEAQAPHRDPRPRPLRRRAPDTPVPHGGVGRGQSRGDRRGARGRRPVCAGGKSPRHLHSQLRQRQSHQRAHQRHGCRFHHRRAGHRLLVGVRCCRCQRGRRHDGAGSEDRERFRARCARRVVFQRDAHLPP